jgi:hypothetical protein
MSMVNGVKHHVYAKIRSTHDSNWTVTKVYRENKLVSTSVAEFIDRKKEYAPDVAWTVF